MKTIAEIKAECHEIIRLADQATKAPWHIGHRHNLVMTGPKDSLRGSVAHCHFTHSGSTAARNPTGEQSITNASFIAASRSFAPLAAKAMLLAIDGFNHLAVCGTADERQYALPKIEAIRQMWESQPC